MGIALPSIKTPSVPSIQSDSKEYRQVQSSIKCWIESHQSELLRNGLNEEHYSIKAIKRGTAVIVYVESKLCHTSIKLQPKSTKNLECTMEYPTGLKMLHFVILKILRTLGKSLY